MIETNNKGLVHVTRCITSMVERNVGHIINISSTAASLAHMGEMCMVQPKPLLSNLA